jgi:hypothetical protein
LEDPIIGTSGAPHLMLGDSMKVMNMQVFIPFALGMPENRDFQALNLFDRNTSDSPTSRQRGSRLIDRLVTAQP